MQRHNPRLGGPDPVGVLSVGNGEFAFTTDITGLQTFLRDGAAIPLGTMSQWAWHTEPLPAGLHRESFRWLDLDTYGRKVPYPYFGDTFFGLPRLGHEGSPEHREVGRWLYENPHRVHLLSLIHI